jgi:hypothetical protein
MEHRIIKIALLSLVGFTSCYYDVEENLYPKNECVTTNLSFVADIQPILERNCYACHSAAANTANVTLEGHSQLLHQISNGRLLGAIRHDQGYTPMPQGAPKLIACDIAKIEQWVNDGAPNN